MIVDARIKHVATTLAIFLGGFLLPGRFVVSSVETDIFCLKSLKDSLQDPFGYLSTWDFTNTTEAGFICKFWGVECWHYDENKVLNLELSYMGLKGNFPAGLRNCRSLTGLNISYNQISGPIPADLDLILPFVVYIDLSNNQFSGLIPPSIANCSFLNFVGLNNNALWGPIPNEIGLMTSIKYFNASNNMLTGPVPTFFQITPVLDFGNNPGLCGQSLKDCESHSDHHHLPPFFRGFMTGWAVSMGLVFLVCWFAIREIDVKKLTLWCKKKKRPQMNPGRLWPKSTDMNNTFRISEMDKYVTRIPFAELADATGNFSVDKVIGIGKKGRMYKATIRNTLFLAVKWLFNSEHLAGQIAPEVLTLGRYKHPRLVPLVGFCLEKDDTLLLYKYMSNGNLYDWLHPRQGEEGIMGHWALRFKIAVGIAEGLAWLHQNSNIIIIHGAISSKCVLLDKNFEPQISNFWEAQFIKKSTDSTSNSSFLGRGGSQESGLDKKDVFCFGIMLLELITGRKPQELASSIRNPGPPTSLLANFSSVLELDGTLINQGFDDEIFQCLQVANNCLRPNPSQRPSMVQVYETLTAFARNNNDASGCNTSFMK